MLKVLDFVAWIARAKRDPIALLARQVTEVVIAVIAKSPTLKDKMVLKGGILMGLAHASPRQTTDIDFTTTMPAKDDVQGNLRQEMDERFAPVAAGLGYTDLIIKTHSVRSNPKKIFSTATAPSLKVKIAYAKRGTPQEAAMNRPGGTPPTLDMDISFNEPLVDVEKYQLSTGEIVLAYSLCELIAEKYRALLQQKIRNRYRRQDVYDLNLLITKLPDEKQLPLVILDSLKTKCDARSVPLSKESIRDKEVYDRAKREWNSLTLEIGDLPDFSDTFDKISKYFEALPW